MPQLKPAFPNRELLSVGLILPHLKAKPNVGGATHRTEQSLEGTRGTMDHSLWQLCVPRDWFWRNKTRCKLTYFRSQLPTSLSQTQRKPGQLFCI